MSVSLTSVPSLGRAGRDGSVSVFFTLLMLWPFFTSLFCSLRNVSCFTVTSVLTIEDVTCLTRITLAAREDVVRVKKLVSSSYTKRLHSAEISDGPEPSQRSADSLNAASLLRLPDIIELLLN